MKNIFFALVIVFAAIGACNPPQSTTGTSTDSAATKSTSDTISTRDTTSTRDTSASTQRDTSMHK
ncbi:MAG TPA: hypothetical protein VF008_19705 [Niastella sp.]